MAVGQKHRVPKKNKLVKGNIDPATCGSGLGGIFLTPVAILSYYDTSQFSATQLFWRIRGIDAGRLGRVRKRHRTGCPFDFFGGVWRGFW